MHQHSLSDVNLRHIACNIRRLVRYKIRDEWKIQNNFQHDSNQSCKLLIVFTIIQIVIAGSNSIHTNNILKHSSKEHSKPDD